MATLHPRPDLRLIQPCKKLLTTLFDIEDAASGAPYSNMTFTEVMDAISDLDACTGEVTNDMLRDRAVLEQVKHNLINGLLA